MSFSRFSRLGVFVFAALVVLFLAVPAPLLADGCMFMPPDPYADRWDFADEKDQQAYINYSNGLEKMILGVSFDQGNDDGVWIFPVPSGPEDVVIDVMSSMPSLSGEEIGRKAQSNLDGMHESMWYMQIYPLVAYPFLSTNYYYDAELGGPTSYALDMEGGRGQNYDVTVHEHVEKNGITTEVLTAGSGDALYDYLSEKGIDLESDSVPVLNEYIGGRYSFVVSWVTPRMFTWSGSNPGFDWEEQDDEESSSDEVLGEDSYGVEDYYGGSNYYDIPSSTGETYRGVFVTFPAEKIYYPLMLTSVYDSLVVPTTVRVLGHVSPEVTGYLKEYTTVEYYIESDFYMGSDFSAEERAEEFFGDVGSGSDVKYTKIEIRAPSKYLTSDLYMGQHSPVHTYYTSAIAKYPTPVWFVLFFTASVVSSFLAGFVIFKDMRSRWGAKRLVVTGLANVFTLVGVIISAMLMRTKNMKPEAEDLVKELRKKGYVWKRRLASVLVLFLIFPLLALGGIFLSLIGMVGELFMYGSHYGTEEAIAAGLAGLIVCFIFIAVISIVLMLLLNVKDADRELFRKAKEYRLSPMVFQPKDGKKIPFIILFSLLFLSLSWLIVEVMQLTV